MYVKKFDEWNLVKKHIEELGTRNTFRKGDIRWVVLGVNIGSEIDGKGSSFNRPCVVVDIFADRLALVFPMSTKLKQAAGYVQLELEGRSVAVCIHQAKVVSIKRVLKRIGTISEDRLSLLKNAYKKFYHL